MDLSEVEKQVVEWHQGCFPKASIDAIFNKFSEEFEEFQVEYYMQRPDIFDGAAAEEFADMCIVYMSGCAKLNLPSLTQLIAAKLEINKGRMWGSETSNGDRVREK